LLVVVANVVIVNVVAVVVIVFDTAANHVTEAFGMTILPA